MITVIKLLNYTCSISIQHSDSVGIIVRLEMNTVTGSFWYYHHSVRWNCPERLSASSWSSAPCAGSSSSLFAFKGHTLKQRVFLSPKKWQFKHAVKNDLLGILSWNFTYKFWGHQRLILGGHNTGRLTVKKNCVIWTRHYRPQTFEWWCIWNVSCRYRKVWMVSCIS